VDPVKIRLWKLGSIRLCVPGGGAVRRCGLVWCSDRWYNCKLPALRGNGGQSDPRLGKSKSPQWIQQRFR